LGALGAIYNILHNSNWRLMFCQRFQSRNAPPTLSQGTFSARGSRLSLQETRPGGNNSHAVSFDE
jgi:hypothetical protein